jgi:hypothetical protein
MKRGNPELAKSALLETVENQIRNNEPPEARVTLERLLKEGSSREEAVRLIASALVSEIYGVLKNDVPYDNARYVTNLHRLPKLPWETK